MGEDDGALPQYVRDVHDVARMIPPGRVTTYGAIADYLTLGSARMVGRAMFLALGRDVPAHRVVNARGELSGRHHFRPPRAMQQQLEDEGVTIENDRVRDFSTHLWIPADELNL